MKLIVLCIVLVCAVSGYSQSGKLKLNSFDLDYGFYKINNYFQQNIIEESEFYREEEVIRVGPFRSNQSIGTGGFGINGSINLVPYSKKKEGYRSHQVLRLSVGFISHTGIGLPFTRNKTSFPYDTLIVETTSTQGGPVLVDIIPRDSVVRNNTGGQISSSVIRLGVQYMFSLSKGLISISAGPGLDLNLGINSELHQYSSRRVSIDNDGYVYPNEILEGYSSNISSVSRISPTISIAPNVSLQISKDAKQRDCWFDHTSIYLSSQLGTQLTFLKDYGLKPALVFGGNLGLRYSL